MRLTSDQEKAKTKNLYAFRERMEGGEDDDEDLSSDDESLSKGKGKKDEEGKSKGRRESRRLLHLVTSYLSSLPHDVRRCIDGWHNRK